MQNIGDFIDTTQMEMAITAIKRYQKAYMAANRVTGVMVKWKKGWYVIYQPFVGTSFHRPTKFRNMIDVLEKRVREMMEVGK